VDCAPDTEAKMASRARDAGLSMFCCSTEQWAGWHFGELSGG
jgi:hypothetical protein